MATIDDCLTALKRILGDLAANPAASGLDRSLSCRLTDLGQIVQARSELMRYEQMTHVPAEALGARMTRNPSLRAFFIDALSRIRSAS